MTRLTILSSIILCASVNLSAADDIKSLQYKYSYGDTVSAMEDDAFLICGDCRSDKLDKLPKQIVAIRMSPIDEVEPDPANRVDLGQPSITIPVQRDVLSRPDVYLGDIHFRFDKSNLQASEMSKIDRIVKMIPPSVQVSVTGYACTIGTKNHNQKLSEVRAQKVAQYLRNKGVRVSIVEGKGECCEVSKSKKANRRVEIIQKRNGTNE